MRTPRGSANEKRRSRSYLHVLAEHRRKEREHGERDIPLPASRQSTSVIVRQGTGDARTFYVACVCK